MTPIITTPAKIFAEHDLQRRGGDGHQELEGLHPLFIGEEPHGQKRHDEEEEEQRVVVGRRDDHVVEVERGQASLVAGLHEALALQDEAGQVLVEHVPEQQGEAGETRVADHRGEVDGELFFRDGQDLVHARSLLMPSPT
jgi:hypothetical protein